MPFPASLQTIEVQGTVEEYPDGDPALPGTAKFVGTQWLFGPADDVIVRPVEAVVPLDENGSFSVELPSTNDPQWNPQGWSYAVTITAAGKKLTGTLELPYDGPLTVNIADVLQAGTVVPGESYILLAARGAAGGVASLGVDGKVPAGQLPAASAVAWTSVTGKPTFVAVATTGDYVDLINRPTLATVATSGSYADLSAKPTIPSTPAGVGLANVDNTSDANKPISTATANALNLKVSTTGGTGLTLANGALFAQQSATRVDIGFSNAATGAGFEVYKGTDASKPGQMVLLFGGNGTGGSLTSMHHDGVGAYTTAQVITKTGVSINGDLSVAGVPTAPTATAGTNTTQLATTAFVAALGALKANLASPTFTGTPTLPTGTVATTQTAGNSTTALATTAFVTVADALKANLASPTFTGVPAAPTAAPGTNTTQLATTAFAAAMAALKADLASPTFTGVPVAPTAAPGTNTTQLATTAFTKAADDLINFTALTAYDQSQIVSRAVILPTDHGLGGWTFPTDSIQGGTILATAGLSYVVRLKAMGATITNILLHFTAGGATLTAGQCFASLHNDAGAILGSSAVTADQATNWASGGMKVMPLTVAQAVTPGNWYKIRFWFQGTTGPTLSRAVNSSSAITNAGLVAPNFRYGTADTGLTTSALAPGTIGTITGGATAWWVAVS
jgi:hypothetical protein